MRRRRKRRKEEGDRCNLKGQHQQRIPLLKEKVAMRIHTSSRADGDARSSDGHQPAQTTTAVERESVRGRGTKRRRTEWWRTQRSSGRRRKRK